MTTNPSEEFQTTAYSLATEFSVLRKRFDRDCGHMIIARKKNVRETFFAWLGYTSLEHA